MGHTRCVPIFLLFSAGGDNVIGIKHLNDTYSEKRIEKSLTFIFTDGIFIKSLMGDREIVL